MAIVKLQLDLDVWFLWGWTMLALYWWFVR